MNRFIIFVFGLSAVMCCGCAGTKTDRADSINCHNQMVSILFAARTWADDHGGVFPNNFLILSNEGAAPQMFVCPSDVNHRPAQYWESFNPDNCSYEIVTPGLNEADNQSVFIRCKIHGYMGYADCTVFDGHRRLLKISP